jgi:hypothetical protein
MAICRETLKQILHGVYPEHSRRIQDDRYFVMLSEAKHLLFLFHYSIIPILQHSNSLHMSKKTVSFSPWSRMSKR